MLPAVVMTALAGAAGFMILSGGGESVRAADNVLPSLDAIAHVAGLGIDQVSVSGHRFTVDSDVLDALQLGRQRNAWSFDPIAARHRIEALPWVKTVEVTRHWPGQLSVRITERRPEAVWTHATRKLLIDETGRRLSAADPASHQRLMQISGSGAPEEFAALRSALARHPAIAERLASAERVTERRWTLHLVNGTEILLPADREVAALDRLEHEPGLLRLAQHGNHLIDLRIEGRPSWRALARSGIKASSLSSGADGVSRRISVSREE